MKKHILLVQPPKEDVSPIRGLNDIPYGLLKIGGYFLDQGHEVTLINGTTNVVTLEPVKTMRCGNYENEHRERNVYHLGMPFEEFRKRLREIKKPDEIWVTSTMTYYYKGVHRAIKICKEEFPGVHIKLGGIYASLCPEHAKTSGADEILKGPYWPAEQSRTAIELLDKIPGYFIIKYTRGCPHDCSFCAVTKLEGHKMHYIETEKFVRELEEKYYDYGICNMKLWESNLLVDAENRFEKVLDRIIQKRLPIHLSFPEGLQPARVYPRLARKMMRAGVDTFAIPLESSDAKMSKRFRKPSSLKNFDNSVKYFKAVGFSPLQVKIFVLVGLPEQTLSSIVRSDLRVLAMNCKVANLYFTPIPGTDEYENYKDIVEGKDLQELHPTLFPCASEELRVEDLENLFVINGMTSIYDPIFTSENRVMATLREAMKEYIQPISTDQMRTFKFSREFYIFDIPDAERKIGNVEAGKKIIEFLGRAKKEGIHYAFLKPLPRCMFDVNNGNGAKKYDIPTHSEKCLNLLIDGCSLHQIEDRDKNKVNALIQENASPTCKNCIHFKRRTCGIACL